MRRRQDYKETGDKNQASSLLLKGRQTHFPLKDVGGRKEDKWRTETFCLEAKGNKTVTLAYKVVVHGGSLLEMRNTVLWGGFTRSEEGGNDDPRDS